MGSLKLKKSFSGNDLPNLTLLISLIAESGAEELEVEKMHISAEMAQRQIVDEHQVDGIQSPLSPVTDEEGEETSYLGKRPFR